MTNHALMRELRDAGLTIVCPSIKHRGGVIVGHALTSDRLVPFRNTHVLLPCEDPRATIIKPKEAEENE